MKNKASNSPLEARKQVRSKLGNATVKQAKKAIKDSQEGKIPPIESMDDLAKHLEQEVVVLEGARAVAWIVVVALIWGGLVIGCEYLIRWFFSI